MIEVTPEIILDENELTFEFVRASGPGGQNVNKVATAVQLRFNAMHSPSLPDRVRERLLTLQRNRINNDGVLIIRASRFRSQDKNRRDAVDRLVLMIQQAAARRKARRATRPTASSRADRLSKKRQRGDTKQRRRPIRDTDE